MTRTSTLEFPVKVALVSLAWAVVVALVPRLARAEEADQDRVAIESFRGPQAQRLQGAVETGLMHRYYVVPDFSVEEMARRRGVALGDPEGMAEVGKALQVRAFLSASVQKKGTWKVQMVVRRGDTGEALGRFVVADRRLEQLESTLAKRASQKVGALLARASYTETRVSPPGQVVAEPGPRAGVVEPPSLDAHAKAIPPVRAGGGPAVLEIGLSSRVFNRSFTHTQNQSRLADYELAGAFAAALSARAHPFALSMPALAGLGVEGALEYGLGVGSRVAGSQQRSSTDVRSWSIGLGYEVASGPLTLAPSVAYGATTFDTGSPDAPNADYRTLAPGASLRVQAAERVSLRAAAHYLHVLSAGSLTAAQRFPRATANGMEATAGIGFAVTPTVELAATGGLRRFGIATNVVPGDRAIAGGAIDQTTWLGAGIEYRPELR